MRELNAVLVIAHRDLLKFLRDRPRILSTFIFPFIFIAAFGGAMEASLPASFGFMAFMFTGIFAQTLFQSSALGIISLIEDRENDFSQEVFVSPISRYAIVFGKILGETLVALPQGAGIVLFALVLGISMSLTQLLALVPIALVICLFGGAFGLLILANLGSQRSANQIFPFIILPQFFVAGVFAPIGVLPLWLDVLSRIAPLRYAVDLARGVFYVGEPDYSAVVVASPLFNLAVIGVLFAVFLVAGTTLFVRKEQNR